MISSKSLIVVIFILLAFSLGGLFIFKPFEASIFESGTVNQVQKTCPVNHKCFARPILDCTSPDIEQKVVFRTNSKWIAFDWDEDGDLDCFSNHVNPSPRYNIDWNSKFLIPFDSPIWKGQVMYAYANWVFISNKDASSSGYGATDRFFAGSGCELSSTPTSNGFYEVLEGEQNTYNCIKAIKIDGQLQDYISWKSDNPTLAEGYSPSNYEYELSQSQTFEYAGDFYWDAILLEEIINECSIPDGRSLEIGKSTCYNNNVVKCDIESFTGNIKLKTEKCLEENKCNQNTFTCEPPYTVNVKLNDEVANENDFKQIERGSKINLEVEVIDYSTRSNTVSVFISGTSISDADFSSRELRKFTLDTPITVGKYYLTVNIDHEEGIFSKEYPIDIIEPIIIDFTSPSHIQYDNKPIEVVAFTYTGFGTSESVVDIKFSAIYEGRSVEPIKVIPKATSFEVFYNLVGNGDLYIQAQVQREKGGILSDWTKPYHVVVKKAIIEVKPEFINNLGISTHTNYFTTSIAGELIETDNIVEVSQHGRIVASYNPVRVSKGRYKFDHYFDEAGTYTVFISSRSGIITGCLKNSGSLQCDGEKISIVKGGNIDPNDDVVKTNPLLYLVIIVFSVAIIYLIYMLRNK